MLENIYLTIFSKCGLDGTISLVSEIFIFSLTLTKFKIIASRTFNSIITLFLAYILYQFYKKNQKKFYFYWALGFIFYGINITIRIFYQPSFSLDTFFDLIIGFFSYLFVALGFTFMLIGIGELIMKTRYLILATLILPLFPILQIVTDHIFISLSFLMMLLPYAFMALSLLIINWKIKLNLNLLTIGWFILFFINIGFFTQTMDRGLVEIMSGFGKIVLYLGMTQPQFSYIVDDLRSFLLGGIPTEYLDTEMGKFILVNLENAGRRKEVQWIKERALKNSNKGIRTILISLYDMITSTEVFDEDIKEELYFIRIIQGMRKSDVNFGEGIMTINEDLNNLDLLISDIFNFSYQKNVPCEIIIFTLSHLIHTHGWKRLYGYFTSKMPMLKSSKINLACFYYPSTHEAASDILKFETIADDIISYNI